MTVDTKGFVMTKQKDPFETFKLIKGAIFELIKTDSGKNDITAVWSENYTMPRCEIMDFSAMMSINFTFRGEAREMSVYLDCDNDYSETKKGKKIILSLGAWGSSVELMNCALKSMSHLGDLYILENDSSGDWQKLD